MSHKHHHAGCGCQFCTRSGPRRIYAPINERLVAQREIDPATGCWLWLGARSPAGYGQIGYGGIKHVHRLSYSLACGPIPVGMCVLHRCDTPACFNPDHLFLGTKGDNWRDCLAKGRANTKANKTHCKRGHAFTPENTIPRGPDGRWRECRTCKQSSYNAELRMSQ